MRILLFVHKDVWTKRISMGNKKKQLHALRFLLTVTSKLWSFKEIWRSSRQRISNSWSRRIAGYLQMDHKFWDSGSDPLFLVCKQQLGKGPLSLKPASPPTASTYSVPVPLGQRLKQPGGPCCKIMEVRMKAAGKERASCYDNLKHSFNLIQTFCWDTRHQALEGRGSLESLEVGPNFQNQYSWHVHVSATSPIHA